MAHSAGFTTLEKNIQDAETSLLTGVSPNPFESLDVSSIFKIRSYILITHAEFETYIEGAAHLILEKLISDAASNQGQQKFLLSFSHWYYTKKFINLSERKRNDYIASINGATKKDISILNSIKNEFINLIKSNQGIKECDKLFSPLGIELNPLLVANMDSFGKHRGDYAHNSHSLTRCISVENAKESVHNILQNLQEFDSNTVSKYLDIDVDEQPLEHT